MRSRQETSDKTGGAPVRRASVNRRGRPPTSPTPRGRAKKIRRARTVSVKLIENNDQVSSVSVTEMSEDLDIQEEEIHSLDIGQGSVHEIDDTLAFEENNLQIIPWEMRDEVTTSTEINEEEDIYVHRSADVLKRTRMFSCFDCPPIPLCRMIPYARVRGLRDDLSGLKSAFAKEGYMQEKGAFIVSLWTFKREEAFVTDETKEKWDPLWREINEEFEEELKLQPKFKDLTTHMFYVWEGNHRTFAWSEAIKEKFSTSREKHCRVLCTIIDPTKVPEIALLSSLQRMNAMNMHALVATHLRDEIVNTNHICAADHESYIKTLPEKDQKLIATVRKKYAKGVEPWYPLTRRYLGMLVFDVQITKEKETRVLQLKHGLSEEDLKKEEKVIQREIVHKYQERIGKLLNIVDPNLGTDWLTRIMSLKWRHDSWATLEKLNMIALQEAPVQNKIHWVSLLESDKITRAAFGLKKGDHVFRHWLRREGYLARVFDRATQLVSDFLDVPGGTSLPHDCTLEFYFDEIKFEARPFLYPLEVSLEAKTKDVEKQALKKVDTFRMAAQRLSYRFLLFLASKQILPAIPYIVRQWTQTTLEETYMYPPSMPTLTTWERDTCPWWLDMEKGRVLARERELRDAMLRDEVAQDRPEPSASTHERQPGVSSFHKEKEIMVDTTIVEDVSEFVSDSLGTIVARKSLRFVYVLESPLRCPVLSVDTRCIAIVGDYISIAADFREGVCNASWSLVHDHMARVRSGGISYTRGGSPVSWAADFIFVDLPFGGLHLGSTSLPHWDICTEDHVRSAIHLSFSTLADFGWLLIMASMEGEVIGWVERFCRASKMVVHRRIVVLHHDSYGYSESICGRVQCHCSMLLMVHRIGMQPSCYVTESTAMFSRLGIQLSDSIMTHHLPELSQARSGLGAPWRGGLQRSQAFVAAFVELLCRRGGICLELGCGTAPVLTACLSSGRACAALDIDEPLISDYVVPLLRPKKRGREEASTSLLDGDEGDMPSRVNPYDD